MKIKAVVATLNPDKRDYALSFKLEDLHELAKPNYNPVILLNYDATKPPVGLFTKTEVVAEQLVVEGELFDDLVKDLPIKSMYLAPLYMYNPKPQLLGFGLIREPVDETLSPIEII